MNSSKTRSVRSRLASHLAFGIASVASAAFALGCSGEFPLGTAETSRGLLGDGSDGVGSVSDGALLATLGAADVTMGADPMARVARVGDLDADGHEDSAESSADFATGVAFARVRYGGPRPSDRGRRARVRAMR